MRLEIKNLACGYGSKRVIEGFSATIESGMIYCLLGPNGVGKTTLFKTVLGLLPRLDGEILLDERDIARYSTGELARAMAYVPQAHVPPFAFSVQDVVVMGEVANRGLFCAPCADDYAHAQQILGELGISSLADRVYTELSGGERQMVLIARALAQRPRFLMMDEPTASLDFGNQAQVLSAVRRLASQGLGIVMTTHAPEQVAQCGAVGTLVLRDGTFAYGDASVLLTAENLRRAYGIDVMVADVPYDGRSLRVCQPLIADGLCM